MVRLYTLKSRPRKNNMSFTSALQGTQINQRYRQNASQLQNIDRDIRDDELAFQDSTRKRNSLIGLTGDVVNWMGTTGKNLTDTSKNLNTVMDEEMTFNWKDAILGKGGFSKAGGPGEGINPISLKDIGKTTNFQGWMNAEGLDNTFVKSANLMSSDNPAQGLLKYYNLQKKAAEDERFNAKMKALKAATNQKISDAPESPQTSVEREQLNTTYDNYDFKEDENMALDEYGYPISEEPSTNSNQILSGGWGMFGRP